ncbi:unnamed protein product [Arctogadus glacialis]
MAWYHSLGLVVTRQDKSSIKSSHNEGAFQALAAARLGVDIQQRHTGSGGEEHTVSWIQLFADEPLTDSALV